MTMYLWRSEETAPVRGRAMVLSAVALAAVPAMLAVVPVRLAIRAPGVILGGRETAIRAETPGFLSQVIVPSGAPVRAGDPLVVLTNDAVADKLTEACTRRDAAQVRRDAFRVSQPAKALEEEQRMIAGDAEVRHRQHQLESLEPRTAREGRVLMHLESRDVGRFIPLGGEIATVLEGTPEIRCLLTSEDMAAAGPRIGQVVECRSSIAPGEVIQGTIETISPAGWRRVPLPSLTHLAGGEIAVAPETGEAMQPYFLVTIRMPDAMQGLFLHGGHALVRLPSRWEPVGLHLYRRVARFLDLLEKS
jgi:hypothetical protein